MKKVIVLGVLFILPLVAYMFFASGVHHFSKLPILEKNIGNLNAFHKQNDSISLEGKISVIGFMGSELNITQGNIFNINQKIYNYFKDFKDFQMLMIMPLGTEEKVNNVMRDLDGITDTKKWNFVYGSQEEIQSFFDSLKTPYKLNNKNHTPYIFIVDKDKALRGRDDDEELGKLYGYNSGSVAEINGKMKDDVKVILAEYRLALKKYNKINTKINE